MFCLTCLWIIRKIIKLFDGWWVDAESAVCTNIWRSISEANESKYHLKEMWPRFCVVANGCCWWWMVINPVDLCFDSFQIERTESNGTTRSIQCAVRHNWNGSSPTLSEAGVGDLHQTYSIAWFVQSSSWAFNDRTIVSPVTHFERPFSRLRFWKVSPFDLSDKRLTFEIANENHRHICELCVCQRHSAEWFISNVSSDCSRRTFNGFCCDRKIWIICIACIYPVSLDLSMVYLCFDDKTNKKTKKIFFSFKLQLHSIWRNINRFVILSMNALPKTDCQMGTISIRMATCETETAIKSTLNCHFDIWMFGFSLVQCEQMPIDYRNPSLSHILSRSHSLLFSIAQIPIDFDSLHWLFNVNYNWSD